MPIRWAVIGAGGIANRRTIPEGIIPASCAQLVAVQDVLAERAKAVGEQWGVPAFTDEAALLALRVRRRRPRLRHGCGACLQSLGHVERVRAAAACPRRLFPVCAGTTNSEPPRPCARKPADRPAAPRPPQWKSCDGRPAPRPRLPATSERVRPSR